jgi:tetratricopeptide (TPR) repeat protein
MTTLPTQPRPPSARVPRRPERHTQDLRSHRNLRGPYTAGGQLLRRLVPELMSVDPDLIKPASTAVVAIAPDLESDVPIRPQTLTDLAQGDERTRFYAVQRTRDLAFMVSELVIVWARTCHPEGVTLRFWELADADPTDVQLVRTLRRRCDPVVLEIVDAGPRPAGGPDGDVTSGPNPDRAQRYIDADGTSTDPADLAAYQQLTGPERRARHSRRGRLLLERSEPGTQLGSIPYHLERGENPAEAATWLVAGQNQTFREGFYEAALDLGRRGRVLVSPDEDAKTHNYLTKRVIGALTYLSRCDEAMALIAEHRCTTTEVAEQMNDAYMMAMIYTRHLDPARIDQDVALAWVNTAIALAEGAPTAERRAFFVAFMRNARALVELHRGNLTGSLDLVNQAIEIADQHLTTDQHYLHRTVLINNRARVLLGLKDYDGALTAFNEVLERDPEYDEPYFDRAVAHKAHGDLGAALRDLNQAIKLSVAFTDAYYNRADIRLDLGEEELALADLDTVLDIDPDYVEALLNRAALLIGAGDLEAAEADLAHGLSLKPDHAHLWSARGLLRSEQGAEAEALKCYATALTLDPELVEVYANRAVLHFTAGRCPESVVDLDRAIALGDTGALRVNRGIAHSELGDHEAAVRDFDTALASTDVDPADVLFRRGLSRHALGQLDRALADWTRHLELTAAAGEISDHAAQIAALSGGRIDGPGAS